MDHRLAPLPIDDARADFETALCAHRCVILEAPPGAGKTTRVPAWVLALRDAGKLGPGRGKILVLEPRRIAARLSAERVASERGERTGESVGYRVRFEESIGPNTAVEFITEGILTRRFQSDAFLDGVTAVVLDEVHERSVHTDLALGFLRELLDMRDDLFVVVMSATLDGSRLSAFMRDAPVVKSEGRMFPVAVTTAKGVPKGADDRPLEVRTAAAIFELTNAPDDDGGDVLVFLPGAGEIDRTANHLRTRSPPFDVYPLYGALPVAAQQKALRRGDRRRVVLATNLAETSLTVEGVTAVVDSGLRKVARFDPASGLDRLHVVKVSQASSTQRAGRAGRTAPGRVIRLYSENERMTFARFDAPELANLDLAPVVLALCAFAGSDPARFPLLDPLAPAKVEQAVSLLRLLGALDVDGYQLTPKGRALADLPAHPRIGAVLLAGRANALVPEAAAMAAVLAERDILTSASQRALAHHDSDILYRTELLDDNHAPGLVDRGAVSQVQKVRRQFEQLTRRAPVVKSLELPPACERPLSTLLLAGFADRVCVRRTDDPQRALMVGRKGVRFDGRSGVHQAKVFVATSLFGGASGTPRPHEGGAREAVVTMASAIAEEDLARALPNLMGEYQTIAWDSEREAVVAVRETRFVDVVLKRHQEGAPKTLDATSQAIAADLVFNHARTSLHDVMPIVGDFAQTLARVKFAAQHLAKHEKDDDTWPDVAEPSFLEDLLRDACEDARSFADLRRTNFSELALRRIGWRLRTILDENVPEKIEVPSGSKIAIDYAAATDTTSSPVLAVRLQEVFGWEQSPSIANVPVLMHLLAPNRRPVQVTQDLANFWNSTYAEVRKELRQRYPKHAWPEDPRSEPAQAGPRRRPRR